MASFSSALAVILILFNGCFTLPVDISDSTQQNAVGLQFTSTTETNEHIGFDVSTSFTTLSENGKREHIDTVSTPTESSTYVHEHQLNDKRELQDSFSTPVEESSTYIVGRVGNDKRGFQDSFSTPVEESSTYVHEHQLNDKRGFQDSFSTPVEESSTYLVESVTNGKREFEDSFSTPVEESSTNPVESVTNGKRESNDDLLVSTTPLNQKLNDFDRRDATNNLQDESDSESDKREVKIGSTTKESLLATSTSSNVVPNLSTSQSLISPSKGKYTGLLPSDNENPEQTSDPGVVTTKPISNMKLIQKITPTSTLKTDLIPTDSEVAQNSTDLIPTDSVVTQNSTDLIPTDSVVTQNSTDTTPRTAIYDQKPSDSFAPNFNGVMILDDNNTMVVTDLPTLAPISTSTIGKQEVPLNQGKKPLYVEKKEQNN